MNQRASKRILIVDDEPVFRMGLEFDLKRLGYTIVSVANGKEALAYLKDHQVEAVISDICMPEMDGVELLRKIKADVPALPIVMLVTGVSELTSADAQEMGAKALFSKTHGRKIMRQSILEILEGKSVDERILPKVKAKLTFHTENTDTQLILNVMALNEKNFAVEAEANLPQVLDECLFEVTCDDKLLTGGDGIVSWVRMADTDSPSFGVEFLRFRGGDTGALTDFLKMNAGE